MSSNQNNTGQKKMSSITRKLQWMVAGNDFKKAFFSSIGLFAVLAFAWIIETEYQALGDVILSRKIDFVGVSFLETELRVRDTFNSVLLTQSIFPEFFFISGVAILNFTIRTFSVLLSLIGNKRRIRNILSPIDDIAKRADEIANFEFTEDKYQILENAISKIEPDDSKEILLHDAELQGIETAMNNLIFKMKENYKQQARFVNDASHELRTPIAVIEGYANMLARWGKEDEKVLDESITAIKNEAENMKRLVEQLLFLARGDSGKMVLNKESLTLNDLMKEIYEESLMIDENHPYRYTKPDYPVVVSADPGLLKQAARILIDNAAKYTKPGDEILLGTGIDENGRPYLQVQDTGIGMSESDVEHMFDRFFRADEARNTPGTGLGLSIAKWIVEKHGGSFSILSRTELGTRIRINL